MVAPDTVVDSIVAGYLTCYIMALVVVMEALGPVTTFYVYAHSTLSSYIVLVCAVLLSSCYASLAL